MNINNIGLILLNSINKNTTENKKIFLNDIKKYKDEKEKEQNKLLEDISYYIANYENKREENKTLYNEYIQRRFSLYNKWMETKKKLDLDNLFKLQKPPYNDVLDIYTKKRPKTNLK